MTKTILAWHFTGDTLRDGSPIPPIGEPLRYDGELVICKQGLHASSRLIDALQYAPGHMLHHVECGGAVIEHGDKLVCSERTIVSSADAEQMLRDFARWCAWQVAGKWDAPSVVRQWLATGDERISAAARDAARAAASAAAWAASSAASRAAAWAAARAAARDAARAAARDAAWDASWAASSDAASAAAWDASWAASSAAASAAAWDASRAAQNAQLESMAGQLLAGTYTKWTANESEGE